MEEMATQVRSYASLGWIVGNPYLTGLWKGCPFGSWLGQQGLPRDLSARYPPTHVRRTFLDNCTSFDETKPSQLTHSTFRKVDLWVLSSNTFFSLTR
jgi:hypothetical protein